MPVGVVDSVDISEYLSVLLTVLTLAKICRCC